MTAVLTAAQFHMHTVAIQSIVLQAITAYLAEQKLPWDRRAFEAQTDVNLEDLSKEVLFYGAEAFPLS